jgi:Cys-rich repeat protein
MKRRFISILTLALAGSSGIVVLGACSAADPSSQGTTGNGSASQTIGAAGGTAETVEGASVEIPAGALAQPTEITITESASEPAPVHAITVGKPYVLGPEGTKFPVAVTVTLPFDASAIPAGRSASDIVVYTAPLGSTEYAALPTVVADGAHVKATTLHFSVFVAAIADAPDDAGTTCTTDRDCARGEVCASGACIVAPPPPVDAGHDDASNDADADAEVGDAGADVVVEDADAAACMTDVDCPLRLVCVQGTCVVPDADADVPDADDAGDAADDAGACSSDTECASGQVCINGVCEVARTP